MNACEQVICNECFTLLAVREERTIGLYGMRRCKCCGCFVNYQGGDGYHAVDATQLEEAKAKFEVKLGGELLAVFGGQKFSLRAGSREQFVAPPEGCIDNDTLRAWIRQRGYGAWTATLNPISWKLDMRWTEP